MRMAFRGAAPRFITLTISATTTTPYNIFTAAGSPTDKVSVTVIINAGVFQGSNTTYAMTTGTGWVVGSVIKIINNGFISGAGGHGGAGGLGTDGEAGAAGNTAITLQWPVEINNGGGYIYGGGGGGGGGGSTGSFFSDALEGGGGGGGAGYAPGPAGAGAPNGAAGGQWYGGPGGVDPGYSGGQGGGPGEAGGVGSSPYFSGGAGGAAGKAIETNGHAVSWTAGYNATQVKGVVG